MELFGLIFLVVALILIGVGIVVGFVACCIAAVLFAVGILSSSVVAGLLTRGVVNVRYQSIGRHQGRPTSRH